MTATMRTTLFDILRGSGLAISTSKGRRLILQGTIQVNGNLITELTDLDMTMFPGDIVLVGGKELLLDEYFDWMENLREKDEVSINRNGTPNPR